MILKYYCRIWSAIYYCCRFKLGARVIMYWVRPLCAVNTALFALSKCVNLHAPGLETSRSQSLQTAIFPAQARENCDSTFYYISYIPGTFFCYISRARGGGSHVKIKHKKLCATSRTSVHVTPRSSCCSCDTRLDNDNYLFFCPHQPSIPRG